mmetsp:Transcript_6868/g.20943  ORF Transcript_6868/g.20943 Transcript_6868/m.20943 type:complete len:637 (-) Transcript_6868:147-2057(-)
MSSSLLVNSTDFNIESFFVAENAKLFSPEKTMEPSQFVCYSPMDFDGDPSESTSSSSSSSENLSNVPPELILDFDLSPAGLRSLPSSTMLLEGFDCQRSSHSFSSGSATLHSLSNSCKDPHCEYDGSDEECGESSASVASSSDSFTSVSDEHSPAHMEVDFPCLDSLFDVPPPESMVNARLDSHSHVAALLACLPAASQSSFTTIATTTTTVPTTVRAAPSMAVIAPKSELTMQADSSLMRFETSPSDIDYGLQLAAYCQNQRDHAMLLFRVSPLLELVCANQLAVQRVQQTRDALFALNLLDVLPILQHAALRESLARACPPPQPFVAHRLPIAMSSGSGVVPAQLDSITLCFGSEAQLAFVIAQVGRRPQPGATAASCASRALPAFRAQPPFSTIASLAAARTLCQQMHCSAALISVSTPVGALDHCSALYHALSSEFSALHARSVAEAAQPSLPLASYPVRPLGSAHSADAVQRASPLSRVPAGDLLPPGIDRSNSDLFDCFVVPRAALPIGKSRSPRSRQRRALSAPPTVHEATSLHRNLRQCKGSSDFVMQDATGSPRSVGAWQSCAKDGKIFRIDTPETMRYQLENKVLRICFQCKMMMQERGLEEPPQIVPGTYCCVCGDQFVWKADLQ